MDVIKTVKPHAKSNRAASRAVPRFLAEAAGASPPVLAARVDVAKTVKPHAKTNRTASAAPLRVFARADQDSIVAPAREFKMKNDNKRLLTPRLRLSQFRKEGAWNAIVLGDVVRFSSGGNPSKDEASYWNGNIPWINSPPSMYDTKLSDSELRVTPLAIGNGTRLAPKGSTTILVRAACSSIACRWALRISMSRLTRMLKR